MCRASGQQPMRGGGGECGLMGGLTGGWSAGDWPQSWLLSVVLAYCGFIYIQSEGP